MFQSLYQKNQNAQATGTLPRQGGEAEPSSAVRPWPAITRGGLVMMEPQSWKLEVTGMVERPRTITYDQLLKMPQVNQYRRIVGAEGWTYRTRWEGVLLRQVLQEVKPLTGARFIRQVNASGHEEFLALDVALSSEMLLATREAGTALHPIYGGPVRLMIFNRFSYKGLGQLVQLDFVRDEGTSFWETFGYEKTGIIQPGKYYAFDLKSFRPIERPGEVVNF